VNSNAEIYSNNSARLDTHEDEQIDQEFELFLGYAEDADVLR